MSERTREPVTPYEHRQMDRMLYAFEQLEDLLPMIHDAAVQIVDDCPVSNDLEMSHRAQFCTQQAMLIRYLAEHALLIASVERLRNAGECGNGASIHEVYERIIPAPAYRDTPEEIKELWGGGRHD